MDINNKQSSYHSAPQYSSAVFNEKNYGDTERWFSHYDGYDLLGKQSIASQRFSPTPISKPLNEYNTQAVLQVHPFFSDAEKTPHLEHENLLGMMNSEVDSSAQKKKSKKPEKPKETLSQERENIALTDLEISELLCFDDMTDMSDTHIQEILDIKEAPDYYFTNFSKKLSEYIQKINGDHGKEAIQELKQFLKCGAEKFVSPDESTATTYFVEYIRRVHQLGQQLPSDMKEKEEVVRYALEQMTKTLDDLTSNVRTACISKAFSNPTFKDALEKVSSSTDHSILRNLQALSAFIFMTNEMNALARDSGVSISPESLDSEASKELSDESLEQSLAGNQPNKKGQIGTEPTDKRSTSQVSENNEIMKEVDKALDDACNYLNQLPKEKEEEKVEPNKVIPKLEAKSAPIAIKPTVVREKSKSVIPAAPAKTYHSIADIRKLTGDATIADAVLKFVENCENETERKELDKFLKERCTEKSEKIISDLNKVTQEAMRPHECVAKFSETVDYRQIAEKIAPPSARKLSDIAENEKVPSKDGNIDETMLHLIKQSVVFPKSWDVKGDPAKWSHEEFLTAFEEIAPMYSESQCLCTRKHVAVFLKLFKLKQYPFLWGYDKERKALPADKEFELMATIMYDRFIGKPLLDYSDCKRLELFTDQQKHTFLKTLFGENVMSALKEIMEGNVRTKTTLPNNSIARAKVLHLNSMIVALYNNMTNGEYYLVIGKKNKDARKRGESFPVKVTNSLAIECLNQEKGSNYIYTKMNLQPIHNN